VAVSFLGRFSNMSEETADVNLDELEPLRDRLLTTSVTKAQLLRLAMKGLNATQAAKVVGCSAETARSHYASVDFRRAVLAKVEEAFEGIDAAYESKRKNLHEMLEEQALKSCEELMQMVEQPDLHPSLKVKIHQDFLNRVEDSAQQTKHSYKMDPTDLRHAASVAREMDAVIPIDRKKVSNE
jgi:phage terminase small subunit